MADKNWNDKLRERLDSYVQTPPEGLWEAVRPEPAAAPRVPFLKRWAPLWWSLAGVTAALALVLLVRTPGQNSPVPVLADAVDSAEAAPGDAASVAEVAPGDAVAAAEGVPETVFADAGLGVDASGAPAHAPSGTTRSVDVSESRARVQNGAEMLTDAAESASRAQNDRDLSTIDSEKAVSGDEDATIEPETLAPSSDAPASDGSETVVPASDPRNPSTDSGLTAPAHSIIKQGRKPLIAASIIGAGGPASKDSRVDYGFRTFASSPKGATSSKPTVALLGRNKPTDVDEVFRIDYQFGLMASWSFSEHWALESGLQYTRLTSYVTRNTGSMSQRTTDAVGYLGLPLHVVYTPWDNGRFSAYLSAGPAVEYGIYHSSSTSDSIGEVNMGTENWSEVPGDWVFSASLNAGLQYKPWALGAFFIQPGVVGRICPGASPSSYYTEHPVSFRIAAGYRFTF